MTRRSDKTFGECSSGGAPAKALNARASRIQFKEARKKALQKSALKALEEVTPQRRSRKAVHKGRAERLQVRRFTKALDEGRFRKQLL